MRLAALLLACATLLACDDEAPAPPVAAPARQFTFEGLQIEERRDGRVIWSGTAERADGDLHEADLETLSVRVPPKEGGANHYHLTAPRGRMAFEQRGTFHDVRITDSAGGVLRAGTAHYLEAEQQILAEAPLEFAARGLTAHATSAVLHLEQGSIDIKGPVQGRFEAPPLAAAPRP